MTSAWVTIAVVALWRQAGQSWRMLAVVFVVGLLVDLAFKLIEIVWSER